MNDLDLIEQLRAAGAHAPAPRHTPDAVLAAGRRAHARRTVLRVGGAGLALAAVVAAGMQLTPDAAGTQTVTAAGNGAPSDGVPGAAAAKPAPRSVAELSPNLDRVNARILQRALGDDFDVRDDSPNGTLRPGSASAAGLPPVYSGRVELVATVSGPAGLKDQCAPMSEKGLVLKGCVTRTLPDGRDVQAQFGHWAPTATYPQQTAGEQVRVLYLQPNGVLVWTDLVLSTDASDSSADSATAAQTWLEGMVDRLGTAAADPDVEAQGFDGNNCSVVDDQWDCSASDPAEKPQATDEDSAKARKVAEAKECAAEGTC